MAEITVTIITEAADVPKRAAELLRSAADLVERGYTEVEAKQDDSSGRSTGDKFTIETRLEY